jgi:23S rRNA pseudouridine2604 synthase
MPQDDSISLNKYISSSGLCSRREADRWIEAGRVKINGVVAQKGNRVSEKDQVTVDGKGLRKKPQTVILAFNKPKGITCTTDRNDNTNIIDYINFKQRVFPIGRLDKASTGLIFLTNNGDIVNKILRRENNKQKEYLVSVNKPITPDFLYKMGKGVKILNTVTDKCKIEKKGKFKFKIVLTQGLNRQIRRMCEALDYKVKTLKRTRIMNIILGKLPVGQWRKLTPKEIEALVSKLN